MHSRALFIALFCVCVFGRCQGTEENPPTEPSSTPPSPTPPSPTPPSPTPPSPTEYTLPDTTATVYVGSDRSSHSNVESESDRAPHSYASYPTYSRYHGRRYPVWNRYPPGKPYYGDWRRNFTDSSSTTADPYSKSFWRLFSRSSPSDTSTYPNTESPTSTAVTERDFNTESYWYATSSPSESSTYPNTGSPTGTNEPESNFNTESYWRRYATSPSSETSAYPYTGSPTGTNEPESNFNTESYWRRYTASPSSETSAYPYRPQSDRVLVEMPGSLAIDQDLHFVISLAPMLRQRSLRDKLGLQVDILNLFRSKVSYDQK